MLCPPKPERKHRQHPVQGQASVPQHYNTQANDVQVGTVRRETMAQASQESGCFAHPGAFAYNQGKLQLLSPQRQ